MQPVYQNSEDKPHSARPKKREATTYSTRRLPNAGEAALEETTEVVLPVGPSMAASRLIIEVLDMIPFEPLAVVLELVVEEIISADGNPIHGRHLS